MEEIRNYKKLNWNEFLHGTGNKDIDLEHKELFERGNNLIDAIEKGNSPEEIGNTIIFLGGYVVKHFKHEEELMEKIKFPLRKQNKLAHEKFILEFSNLNRRFKKEGPTTEIITEVKAKIVDWLVNHIEKIDSKMKNSSTIIFD